MCWLDDRTIITSVFDSRTTQHINKGTPYVEAWWRQHHVLGVKADWTGSKSSLVMVGQSGGNFEQLQNQSELAQILYAFAWKLERRSFIIQHKNKHSIQTRKKWPGQKFTFPRTEILRKCLGWPEGKHVEEMSSQADRLIALVQIRLGIHWVIELGHQNVQTREKFL